jgi:predicted deacetylase
MRFILLRDDDTNALTPIECLETLYRPFLDRGLPVNLATIPEVRENAQTPAGHREGFLPAASNPAVETVPLADNRRLVEYLHANPGFHVAQHGCYHDTFEFDRGDRAEVVRRLERGGMRLREAGFNDVSTFVAPHDRLSRVAFEEVARRFRVISTGWFEWRRLPVTWRLRYLRKRIAGRAHWRVGRTLLLSHPGCLLSHRRPLDTMLAEIRRAVRQQKITVLVTHWWEYFQNRAPHDAFIRVLHQTAEFLATEPDVKVIPFGALANQPESEAELASTPEPAMTPGFSAR